MRGFVDVRNPCSSTAAHQPPRERPCKMTSVKPRSMPTVQTETLSDLSQALTFITRLMVSRRHEAPVIPVLSKR